MYLQTVWTVGILGVGGTEGWLGVRVQISGASQEDVKTQLAKLVLEHGGL